MYITIPYCRYKFYLYKRAPFRQEKPGKKNVKKVGIATLHKNFLDWQK